MFKYVFYGLLAALWLTGCAYTQSALEYAKEGTARVESGYQAKSEMTKYLVEYLKEANRDCGTTMEVIDGKPVVNVKECVRVNDVLTSVDRVEIVKPQKVDDMLDSAGDFVMKATNLAVPIAGVYYNYQTHKASMNASVANTSSNNQLQGTIFESYTGNFQNTTTSNTATTIDSSNNTSVSDTSNISSTDSTTVTSADTTLTDSSNSTTQGE
jgi:hypothetical protein